MVKGKKKVSKSRSPVKGESKSKVSKSKSRSIRHKFANGPKWFIRSSFHPKSSWGFIPKNWKGSLSLVSLVGLNIFAANYFRAVENSLDAFLKFGVVFCLSVFIFMEIAKHKTEGVRAKF